MGPGWMSPPRKVGRDVEKSRKCLIRADQKDRLSIMDTKETRIGRPPKPPGQKMSHRVCVRLTPAQYRRLTARAKRAGVSLSAFIQNRLED